LQVLVAEQPVHRFDLVLHVRVPRQIASEMRERQLAARQQRADDARDGRCSGGVHDHRPIRQPL
jgi:hypothetical protein